MHVKVVGTYIERRIKIRVFQIPRVEYQQWLVTISTTPQTRAQRDIFYHYISMAALIQ